MMAEIIVLRHQLIVFQQTQKSKCLILQTTSLDRIAMPFEMRDRFQLTW